MRFLVERERILLCLKLIRIAPSKDRNRGFSGAILEAAPDGISLFKSFGRIVFANFHVAAMFGHERDALIGDSIEALLPAALWKRKGHLRPSGKLSP